MSRDYTNNILVIYDIELKKFSYPVQINNFFDVDFSNRSFFSVLRDEGIATKVTVALLEEKFNQIIKSDEEVYYTKCHLRAEYDLEKWFTVGFIKSENRTILITITDTNDDADYMHHLERLVEYDELTGLYTRRKFTQQVNSIMLSNKKESLSGKYAILYFDIQRFKAINDLFGKAGGDMLLIHISEVIHNLISDLGFASRIEADRFAVFIKLSGLKLKNLIKELITEIKDYNLVFDIECNLGVYVIKEHTSASVMIDRASLAQKIVKGNYQKRYLFYDESFRNDLLSEQEISGSMDKALETNQFLIYFQPQYDHGTGMLIGAEALVRWNHPEKGLLSPASFIPIFEQNGFITVLDMHVFELTCKFIKNCIDKKIHVVPISTNFSRYDIFQDDFVEKLEVIRSRYAVPVKKLRIEITESAASGGSSYTNKIVKKLHKYGYVVEMDDFGSGYSSLNVLKDIAFDIIKLDMKFLSDKTGSKRGGIILTSIINMARWLKMPVIAEGVEDIKQADYLKSIGCNSIQGYLYSKPLPQERFEQVLISKPHSLPEAEVEFVNNFDSVNFWSPGSQESILFNSFVGPAAMFIYQNKKLEILRVNKKYVQELGMNNSVSELINKDILQAMDKDNQKIYIKMIEDTISSKEERSCETWRKIESDCCGEEKVCIRTDVMLIAKNSKTYMFYATVRNITKEKKTVLQFIESERRFKMASEQANIYFWEYNILTKDMFPCFRCMRDLGLPLVVKNYPEPAINMGIIPEDYADIYREIHKRLEKGEKSIEIEMPLTVGRIPFKVRYTTEFDDAGRPVKAYGSATYIPEK